MLDTNAYFNFLKYAVFPGDDQVKADHTETILRLKKSKCYISAVTRIEIISVIGKYARGASASKEKCNCVISETGERCGHYCYVRERKPMNNKMVKQWLKLESETAAGVSPVLSVSVLPFSAEVLERAQRIIQHALTHNFASMDAVIAATLQKNRTETGMETMQMVTSDKGLKACLDKCDLPYWDAFRK